MEGSNSSSSAAQTSVLGVIQHYQRSIERSQDDKKRLLYCINKLQKLPVKVEHLQQTGIGKTVNSLRKYEGEIGVAAKVLVTKWKAMVAAEEEDEATAAVASAAAAATEPEQHPAPRDSNQHHSNKDDRRKDKERHKDKKRNDDHPKNGQLATSFHMENGESNHSLELSTSLDAGASKKEKSKDSKSHREQKEEKMHKHKSKHKEKERKHHKEGKEESQQQQDHHSSSKRKLEEDLTKKHHREESNSEHKSKKHKSEEEKQKHESGQTKGEHSKHNKEQHSSNSTSKERRDPKPHSKSEDKPSSSKSTSERKRSVDHDDNREASKRSKHKSTKRPSESEHDDGIDSTVGVNFADVLGALDVSTKKKKPLLDVIKPSNSGSRSNGLNGNDKEKGKQKASNKEKPASSATPSTSKAKTESNASKGILEKKPDLLTSTANLPPLDPTISLELPTISNNYKPMPLNQTVMDCVFNTHNSSASKAQKAMTEAEALAHGISSKTVRTKIYSGARSGQIFQVQSLFDLCVRVLQKNIDALEYTGGVPFDVLRPVLERATPTQLFNFEHYNPYLMEDSDELWKLHVQRNYRTQKRQEMETWREMYLRCQEDQERRLSMLTENIKQTQKAITAPVRKTQLAYVDSMVKPPRNILRKQEQYGTRAKAIATPASRVPALSSVIPNAAKVGDVRLRVNPSARDYAQASSSSSSKPKKAPLMAKTLLLFKGRHKR